MGTESASLLSLVPLIAVATAAGVVGCFAVVRRMALAADALSHVALPGIGIAIAFHFHPLLGAAAMLLFGALLVWALEEATHAATETVVGVVFSAALAVGSLMLSRDDLVDVLFGRPGAPSRAEATAAVMVSALVVWFIVRSRHRLVVALISPDMARTVGIDVRRLNLIFLLVFAVTIALGLRYLGVLLMGSLIIIPAATAKRLSGNLSQMLVLSAALAVAASIGGTLLAGWVDREPGPVIVVLAAGVFALSLVVGDAVRRALVGRSARV